MSRDISICLLEDNETIADNWKASLGDKVQLMVFKEPQTLLTRTELEPGFLRQFQCIVLGRYLKKMALDVCDTKLPEILRTYGAEFIFINWQGFLGQDEMSKRFDGRIFQRDGVRWATLRNRIKQAKNRRLGPDLGILNDQPKDSAVDIEPMEKPTETMTDSHHFEELKQSIDLIDLETVDETNPVHDVPSENSEPDHATRSEKCQDLLIKMAKQAGGRHKEKLEFYAKQDTTTGMQLLEAIYNRLLIDQTRAAESCPSQYINSSPMIARSILRDTLYGG